MRKIVFASDELPADLDSSARFSTWHDFMESIYGSLELSRASDRPFSQSMQAGGFDGVGIVQMRGTTDRFTRTSRTVAASRSHGFFLTLNRGQSLMALSQLGREATLKPAAFALGHGHETGHVLGKGGADFSMLVIPHEQLQTLVARVEDLVARPLDADSAAMRHLRRYVDILSADDELGDDPALAEHIGKTITDLVALALGATRDATEIARLRGLRAARLQEILATIRMRFADPGFSAHDAAAAVGVSARYVQNLLWETGASFTERVLELRLQAARSMLADPRNDRYRVSDIATRCGFNEVSYFNRCFRARFGESPTQCRADGAR